MVQSLFPQAEQVKKKETLKGEEEEDRMVDIFFW